MAGMGMKFVMIILVVSFSLILSPINAQAFVPAPAPSSDGIYLSFYFKV